jgi:hypothetical protein
MAVQVSTEMSEFRVGSVQPLFETRAKFQVRYPYDVSADGQRFLINRIVGPAATMTLVVNWPALLNK